MNQIIQANNKSFYLYLKLSRLKKLQKKNPTRAEFTAHSTK